jgi:hypothetical protein
MPDRLSTARKETEMSAITSSRHRPIRPRAIVRVLGALVLLVVGADHYYEYAVDQYSVLPTIGTLFLLNFISATAVGLLLLSPIERLLHRFGRAALAMTSAAGTAIAGTSLAALLVSEQTKLFGFMESNYRPAIIVAIATEAAATLLLGVLLVLTLRDGRAGLPHDGPPNLKLRRTGYTQPTFEHDQVGALRDGSRRLGGAATRSG